MTDDMNKRRDQQAEECANKFYHAQCDITQVMPWSDCKESFINGFDAGVAEMQAQVEFLKMYFNPKDTSFKNMIETFSELSDEQKQALINLTEALLKTKEAK